MTGLERVRKLEVWHDAILLARDVYELSATWPQDERFGLISQVRRAAVSISANLSEGVGRDTPGEMARFGRIALGSLYEVDSLLEVASALNGFSATKDEIRQDIVTLAKRIERFIAYYENLRRDRLREDDGCGYAAGCRDQEPGTRNQEPN